MAINNNLIFSKYNFLLNSKKHGYFIYNSVTNSFFKLNEELFNILSITKDNPSKIKELNIKVKDNLIKSKVIVSKFDDENYITKKKYLSYAKSFSNNSLGLVLVPTMNCNFACPYCYEDSLPTHKMTEEIQDKIVAFAESFDVAKKNIGICWHGGEPLIAFDVMVSLLDKLYSSKNINITSHDLVTNGYLLDLEKINILKKYNLNSIQITIDGIEDTHNQSRPLKSGLPTYNKIIENVDLLLKEFPECFVNIRINVHHQNKRDFSRLYTELNKRWGGKNLHIYMIYVSDNDHCKVKCIRLRDRISFLKDLYKLEGITNVNFFPENQDYGCTATNQNSYIIGVFGELYKCWADVGNKERIVGNLDDNLVNLPVVSEYIVGTDMFSDEKCKDCFLLPVCDGGCNLFRYENRRYGKGYDICPIDLDDLPTLLELHYEQQISNN